MARIQSRIACLYLSCCWVLATNILNSTLLIEWPWGGSSLVRHNQPRLNIAWIADRNIPRITLNKIQSKSQAPDYHTEIIYVWLSNLVCPNIFNQWLSWFHLYEFPDEFWNIPHRYQPEIYLRCLIPSTFILSSNLLRRSDYNLVGKDLPRAVGVPRRLAPVTSLYHPWPAY